MASFKDLTTAVLLAMFCQLTTLSDCRVLQRDCRTFTAISCRAVAIGGGAVGGAMIGTGAGPVGTAIGAGVGAAGGQLLSEACDPFSKWLCGKRRLAMVPPQFDWTNIDKPSELLREFDERTKIILFPQSFDDYQSKDGKISLFDFIERVEDALPAHLHGLAKVAEKFIEADQNGDGLLDREEFALGSWIAQDDDDVNELKRAIMIHGMEF